MDKSGESVRKKQQIKLSNDSVTKEGHCTKQKNTKEGELV
jgi:hypothetical protein